MSNFQMLLENENLIIIAEEIFKESCRELIQNLDEESSNKIQEYVELLSNKKIKRSLENEISEALTPILEKNAILYGTFLYETTPIQENVDVSDKQMLTNIRENSRIDFIIEAMTLKEQAQGSKLKTTGKIGAGLGAAGAAGAGGLYAAGRKSIKAAQKKYDDHSLLNRLSGVKRTDDQGITSTMKKGLGVAKDKYEELTGQ